MPLFMKRTRAVSLFAFALLGCILPSAAQTGTVAFTGWLFDGDKRLAHAARGRFMQFQIPAGAHEFRALYKSAGRGNKGCQPKDCLQLSVESGGHYCVRLSAKEVNAMVVPIMFVDSRIELVSCQEAFQEAGQYKRIDLARVEAALRSELDVSPDFPREP
jgi:hypothetical protein